MANLNATELKVLNNLSNVHNPNVDLGTLVDERTEPHLVFGTPVKSVAASKVLTISGVVKHGETVTIGSDVYLFWADDGDAEIPADKIIVDIGASSQTIIWAEGELAIGVQPTAGDKVTLGTKVYTWVPVGTANADGEISIGTNVAEARTNYVAAVQGTDGFNTMHPLITCENFWEGTCSHYAKIGGTLGNTYATTTSFSSVDNHFHAATLTGGADCLASEAVAELVVMITSDDTQGVGAVDGAGDTVVLTADEPGVAGNQISIAETMPNGAFAGCFGPKPRVRLVDS